MPWLQRHEPFDAHVVHHPVQCGHTGSGREPRSGRAGYRGSCCAQVGDAMRPAVDDEAVPCSVQPAPLEDAWAAMVVSPRTGLAPDQRTDRRLDGGRERRILASRHGAPPAQPSYRSRGRPSTS
jgi:hypothetical protein